MGGRDRSAASPLMRGQRCRAAAPLRLCLAAWSLVLAGGLLAPWLGVLGPLGGFGLAATLVWTHPGAEAPTAGWPVRGLLALVLAFGAARLLWAPVLAWVVPIALAHHAPPPLALVAGAPSPAARLLTGLLAPLLEEGLHRGHVLAALRPRWGDPLAILGSAALFALPHLNPWSVLAALGLGLGLGTARVRGAGLEVCSGVHAGLNLAAG